MNRITTINWRDYQVRYFGTNPTMYIWASKHTGTQGIHGTNDLRDQESLLRELRPDAILHEFFLNVVYDPKTGLFTIRGTGEAAIEFKRNLENDEYRILTETRAIKALADELGHVVIGCDSRADRGAYNGSFEEERHLEQASVILDYNGTVERPRVAIIGNEHCLPNSSLHQFLRREDIHYAVIQKLEEMLVMAR